MNGFFHTFGGNTLSLLVQWSNGPVGSKDRIGISIINQPARYKEFIDFAFNKGYDADFGKKCWEPFGFGFGFGCGQVVGFWLKVTSTSTSGFWLWRIYGNWRTMGSQKDTYNVINVVKFPTKFSLFLPNFGWKHVNICRVYVHPTYERCSWFAFGGFSLSLL